MRADPEPPAETFYDLVGGAVTFHRLVRGFYDRVRADDVLRPLYPDDELDAAEVRLRMFLEQYWGGPRVYSDQRGHPRLRMRHAPFRIGPAERDAWLTAMRASLDDLALPAEQDAVLWDYLERSAHFMVNVPEDVSGGRAAL